MSEYSLCGYYNWQCQNYSSENLIIYVIVCICIQIIYIMKRYATVTKFYITGYYTIALYTNIYAGTESSERRHHRIEGRYQCLQTGDDGMYLQWWMEHFIYLFVLYPNNLSNERYATVTKFYITECYTIALYTNIYAGTESSERRHHRIEGRYQCLSVLSLNSFEGIACLGMFCLYLLLNIQVCLSL